MGIRFELIIPFSSAAAYPCYGDYAPRMEGVALWMPTVYFFRLETFFSAGIQPFSSDMSYAL